MRQRLKGCKGFDFLLIRACEGSMCGLAASGADVERPIVLLTAAKLEGDAHLATIFGLQSVPGTGTMAEGWDRRAGKNGLVACAVVMVLFAKAHDAEGWNRGRGGSGTQSARGEIFNVNPDRTF